MKYKYRNIDRRIIIGLVFSVLLIVLGIFSIGLVKNIKELSSNAELIAKHPFAVSNATKESINLFAHLREDLVVFEFSDINLKKATVDHINSHIDEFHSIHGLIEDRYLGPKTDVKELNSSFELFLFQFEHLLETTLNEDLESTVWIPKLITTIDAIQTDLTTINQFANEKLMEVLVKNDEQHSVIVKEIQLNAILFALVVLIIGVILTFLYQQKRDAQVSLKTIYKNLKEEEHFKDEVLRQMNQGLIVYNKNFEAVLVNNIAWDILELQKKKGSDLQPWNEQWKARYLDGSAIPIEDYPVMQAISRGVEVEGFVMDVVTKNQKRKILEVYCKPQFDEEGNVVQAITTFTDRTEVNQLNAMLASSEKKYQDLFSLSKDACMVLKKGKIVDINKAGLELFGRYDAEHIIGRNPLELSPDDQGSESSSKRKLISIFKIIEDKNYHKFEWFFKSNNEELIPVEIVATKFYEQDTPFYYLVMRNISARLQQQRTIYKQLREKELLLSEIHHRVKNNLAVISGLIQLELFNSTNSEEMELMNKTVARIKSMALIHDEVYHSDHFNHIAMHSLIPKLVDSFISESNSSNALVPVYDLDSISINVNQAMPFGLLLNELLTKFNGSFNLEKKDQPLQCFLKNDGDEISFKFYIKKTLHLFDQKEIKTSEIEFSETLIDVLIAQLNGKVLTAGDESYGFDVRFKLKEIKGTISSLKELV